jgi:hypothetical protein
VSQVEVREGKSEDDHGITHASEKNSDITNGKYGHCPIKGKTYCKNPYDVNAL